MKILNISSLIRNEFISKKKDENTILIDIAKYFDKSNHCIQFINAYIHPKSNFVLSKINKKWREYFDLSKMRGFTANGGYIYTIPIFIAPFKTKINNLLFYISYLLTARRWEKLFRDEQPHIIQALDVDKSAFFARKLSEKFGIPYVVNAREINSSLFGYIRKNIEKSSVIISHGYLHYDITKKIFPSVKSVLIPHGVDSSLFVEPLSDHLNNEKINIVSIGRLINVKNFDLLIRAIKEFKNINLDIYGDGPLKDYLISLINELGLGERIRVIIEPYKPSELKFMLSKYDLFALISFPETFGRVYAEAFVCGLPIIGCQNSGIFGQLVEGEEAFFINHNNLEELISVLQKITDNPGYLQIMRKTILDGRYKFHWSKILDRYSEVYKNVLYGEV